MAKMSQTPLPRAAGMEESLCKNWSWQKYCIVMSVMSWKDFQSWSKTAAKIHHQEFQDEVSWLLIKLIMYHHLNLEFQNISPNKSHFIHVLSISIASPCGVLCRQYFGFFGHLYSSRNLLPETPTTFWTEGWPRNLWGSYCQLTIEQNTGKNQKHVLKKKSKQIVCFGNLGSWAC